MPNFKDNDYVLILDTFATGSIKTGAVGIIRYPRHFKSPCSKIGVEIFGKTNPRSKYGYFWFTEDFLKVITEKEYNEAINKKEESKEEDGMNCRNELAERGCTKVAEGIIATPRNKGIVDLYFERKRSAITNDFSEKQKALIDNDENVIKLKTLIESFNLEQNMDTPRLTPDYYTYITKESKEDVERLYKDYQKGIDALEKLKNEVSAMLSGCPTYDEELEVLRGYEIVTRNPQGGVKMNVIASNSPLLSI